MYKTIKENKKVEIIEKKSKFIGSIFYVQSTEEADKILKEVKKQYYDARHNCFAYRINTKEGMLSKSSDDGEPSGTAGAPMLNIITKNELENVLIIVTRYFGGILLGTGGLVKAYSEATLKAIEEAGGAMEEEGIELKVIINYNDYEKLNYYCKSKELNIIKVDYLDKIECIMEMNNEEKKELIDNINELNFKIENYSEIRNKKIRKNIEI